MQYNGITRFANPVSVPTIPDSSLSKYAAKQQQAIDAAPRTEAATQRSAAMIPDPKHSERADSAAWAWTHDPALLVGVGVCAIVWLASTKLIRR